MKPIQFDYFHIADDVIDLSKCNDTQISKIFSYHSAKQVCVYDLSNIKILKVKQEIKNYIEYIAKSTKFREKSFRRLYLYWILDLLKVGINSDITSVANLSSNDINVILSKIADCKIKREVKWGICRLIRYTVSNLTLQERYDCDWWFIDEDVGLRGDLDRSISFFGVLPELKDNLKDFFQFHKSNYQWDCFNESFLCPFRILISYIVENHIESIEKIDLTSYSDWLDINNHSSKNKNNRKSVNLLIFDTYHKYKDAAASETFYNRDYWDVSQLNIEEERKNKACKVNTLCFTKIKNYENRDLIKKYVWFLISETTLTLTSIKGRLTIFNKFCTLCSDDFNIIKREAVFKVIDLLIDQREKQSMLCILKEMFLYLYNNKYIDSPILYSRDKITRHHKDTNRVVGSFVISQIFAKLDKLPEELMLIYLILYCTGLRISEVVSLKCNCLFTNRNGFLIKSYSVKMKKDQFSAIPLEVFALLDENIRRTTSSSSEYIFKSKKHKNEPVSPASVREHLNRQFEELQIKCEDGTIYRIDIHAYRHYFGTNLHERGISPYIIQKALHHKSIEMTMAYIDILENNIKNGYETFYNKIGEITKANDKNHKLILDYLSKEFRVQALPNGICALPVKLSKCEHANACLNCEYFKTSRKYIDVLKDQLSRTEEILCTARENGWIMQIATNEEVENNLKRIISNIENEKDIYNIERGILLDQQ